MSLWGGQPWPLLFGIQSPADEESHVSKGTVCLFCLSRSELIFIVDWKPEILRSPWFQLTFWKNIFFSTIKLLRVAPSEWQTYNDLQALKPVFWKSLSYRTVSFQGTIIRTSILAYNDEGRCIRLANHPFRSPERAWHYSQSHRYCLSYSIPYRSSKSRNSSWNVIIRWCSRWLSM